MNDDKKLELANKVMAAEKALAEAEAYADEHKLSFYFAPAYGMGGTYEGNPSEFEDYKDDNYLDTPTGWMPSSQSC